MMVRGDVERMTQMRTMSWRVLLAAMAVLSCAVLSPLRAQTTNPFQAFLEGLWPEAKALGISRATFDAAFKGVEPDLGLPDLVRPGANPAGDATSSAKGQAEFTRPPQDYLDRKNLSNLASQARTLSAKHANALAQVESQLGVDRNIVLAIWAARRHSAPTSCRTMRSAYWQPRPTPGVARSYFAGSSCSV